MKLTNYTMLLLLVFAILYISPVSAAGRTYGMEITYYNYYSLSQLKTDIPMRMGYPALKTSFLNLSGYLTKEGNIFDKRFNFTTSIPAEITSNDGLGNNFLLHKEKSSYYKFGIGCDFIYAENLIWAVKQIKEIEEVKFNHGLTTSVFYEKRKLKYKSGQVEKKWEVNGGVGPITNFSLKFSNDLQANFNWKVSFYIPYLSYGEYLSVNEEDERFTSIYHNFLVNNNYDLSLQYRLKDSGKFKVGYRLHSIDGFGNKKPSFSVNELITSKLDFSKGFYCLYKIRY